MNQSSIMPSIPEASKKNPADQDKKETVKKSTIESYEFPACNPHQISAHKEKKNEIQQQGQEASQVDQNLQQNAL